MYYILNETDEVIAADNNLLTLCNAADVSGLSSQLTIEDESITIITEDVKQKFPVSKTSLSGTMGSMTLVALGEAQEIEEEVMPLALDDEISFDIATDDEKESELFEIKDAVEEIEAEKETELFEINDTIEEEITPEPEEIVLDETFDLLGEKNEDVALDEKSDQVEEPVIDDEPIMDLLSEETEDVMNEEGEIIVDITNISQDMGISDEDYAEFLNEYIDTALALEEELQSDDLAVRNGAIATLTDLSEVMRLTEISEIMKKINAASMEQQQGYMGSLYTTLSRLTTQSSSNQIVDEAVEMELFDTVETPAEPEVETETAEVTAEPEINPNSFGTIDLSDVKPKHFDFQLEEAANDLSLPVELIEEFVHDFIEQAHVETKKMLEAYEEGDLSKIQSIGHLLKGASSNLRINALSDTLYKIQFCENEIGLDNLIKDYWAHFLSFEHQINVISN